MKSTSNKGRPRTGRKSTTHCVSLPTEIWDSIQRLREGREVFTSRGNILAGFFTDCIPRPMSMIPKPPSIIVVGWFIEPNFIHRYEDYTPALVRHNGTEWEFVHSCKNNIKDLQCWHYIHIPYNRMRDECAKLLQLSHLV